MFVLDTNTLVYFFRGEGRVARRLLATAPSDIAVPSVVVYELEVGIAKSSEPAKRRKQLDDFLGAVAVLSFGAPEARVAAKLDGLVGGRDALVAGTALASRGTLVTRNLREFCRVPGLDVEDWYG